MLRQYHCLESDFSLTWVPIENTRLHPKVYTPSLLNAYTRGHKLGIHKTTIAQNREENSRIVESKEGDERRGEERRGDACCELMQQGSKLFIL